MICLSVTSYGEYRLLCPHLLRKIVGPLHILCSSVAVITASKSNRRVRTLNCHRTKMNKITKLYNTNFYMTRLSSDTISKKSINLLVVKLIDANSRYLEMEVARNCSQL